MWFSVTQLIRIMNYGKPLENSPISYEEGSFRGKIAIRTNTRAGFSAFADENCEAFPLILYLIGVRQMGGLCSEKHQTLVRKISVDIQTVWYSVFFLMV